ncbi:MAG: nitrite/sulfite reductase [Nitrososphaerota archaeon]|nr:nitrite/sulfite reductase [Nitrososphaerota archaeon]MDG7043572.1 nitrite/sulfite reductase [Nitrososphaerota archaeon]
MTLSYSGIIPLTKDMSVEDILAFADRYALGSEAKRGSVHFLRVCVPGGIMTLDQFMGVAGIVKTYGRGYAEITTRQDIQTHWIDAEESIEIFSKLQTLGLSTDQCGQARSIVGYGDVRNIMGCPVAGIDREEIFDATALIRELKSFFLGNRDFMNLPHKFKASVSGCHLNCTFPEIQDVGFVATKKEGGRTGFVAFVGGGCGSPAKMAKPLGLFIEPEAVFDVAVALLEIFRGHGRRTSKSTARFKFLVEEWGADRLRSALMEKVSHGLEIYAQGPPPTSGREHIGVNRQKQGNRYYVNFPVQGGVLTCEQMFQIASIAERFGRPEIRLTPFQNLILSGIERKNVTTVIDKMEKIGLSLKASPFSWTVLSCAGGFCSKAPESIEGRTYDIVKHIEKKFPTSLKDMNINIFISGCPHACARHPVADMGLQAISYRDGGNIHISYNIYVGGGLGANSSFAKLIIRGIEADKVSTAVEELISKFLRDKSDGETFREFYRRNMNLGAKI